MADMVHPMTNKARTEFIASMKGRTPIQWLMLNRPKLRSVSDAITTFNRFITNYPDIAEEYGALGMEMNELACERQVVLLSKTREDGINFLSAWYGRPKNAMAYRYQAIKEEISHMDAETLAKEEMMFKDQAIAAYSTILEQINAISSEVSEMSDFSMIAILNLKKRIADLEHAKSVLLDEMTGRGGECERISNRLDEIRKKISSIDEVKELYDKEGI